MPHKDDILTNKADAGADSGNVRRYGLLGRGISYSQSPRIYTPWFEKHKVSAAFDLIDMAGVDEAILDELADQYAGFCITVPYKQIIFEILMRRLLIDPDSVKISPLAINCGAVNVLRFDGDMIAATNTDAMALSSLLPDLTHQDQVVILGVGGAARATIAAVQSAGIGSIIVIGRAKVAVLPEGVRYISVADMNADMVRTALAALAPTLVVNATPLGAGRHGDEGWLLKIIEALPDDQLRSAVDWVYGDEETLLARWATAKGLPVIDGLTLLRTQATFAFQHWFGQLP